jgi:hypothetical protein
MQQPAQTVLHQQSTNGLAHVASSYATFLARKLKQFTAGFALFLFELHRVHWGKEASSYWFVLVYWSTPAIKISYFIKGAMVKAFIRRWCCHVGGNNFITLW